MNLGEKIKTLRLERNLTQAQLSRILNVAVSAISAYETSNRYPSYENLISLSRIFHVSTDYLLGIDKTRTLDISDLNENEIQVVTQMVDLLRERK